jgi:hypothetical protein
MSKSLNIYPKPTRKRWRAVITYQGKHDPDTVEFDEFDQLDFFIEHGPSFHTINKITIELNWKEA